MEQQIEAEAAAKKKRKEVLLLGIIFGGLIVPLIGVMFFIDTYADSKMPQHHIEGAADN